MIATSCFAIALTLLPLDSVSLAQPGSTPLAPAAIVTPDAPSLDSSRFGPFPSTVWSQLIWTATILPYYMQFDWSNPGLSDAQRYDWCQYAPDAAWQSWNTACNNNNKRRAKRKVRNYFGL